MCLKSRLGIFRVVECPFLRVRPDAEKEDIAVELPLKLRRYTRALVDVVLLKDCLPTLRRPQRVQAKASRDASEASTTRSLTYQKSFRDQHPRSVSIVRKEDEG